MKLEAENPHVFVPDGKPIEEALARITHLGIGAHHDDLEFHALHGILECWQQEGRSFGGITCTDGGGSSRVGPYAGFSDKQMRAIRIEEQNAAATIGRYGVMLQLGYASSRVCDQQDEALRKDLHAVLSAMRPEVVYTHNLADKHETHIGIALSVIAAIRALPRDCRPRRLLGFEGWRALDWLSGEDKVRLNVSRHPNLAAALGGVFDSQIAGGKRYDLAMDGRRAANATMDDPYQPDSADRVTYAMDLTPLIQDDSLDLLEFTLGFLRRFEEDIRKKVIGD